MEIVAPFEGLNAQEAEELMARLLSSGEDPPDLLMTKFVFWMIGLGENMRAVAAARRIVALAPTTESFRLLRLAQNRAGLVEEAAQLDDRIPRLSDMAQEVIGRLARREPVARENVRALVRELCAGDE